MIPPKEMNCEIVSTSEVTRETSDPRRSVPCVSRGKIVHVPERADAQRGETALGRAEEPAVHEHLRGGRDAEQGHGDEHGPHHETHVRRGRLENADVDDLLDGDRDDHLAERGDERKSERDADPVEDLRAQPQATAERREPALAGVAVDAHPRRRGRRRPRCRRRGRRRCGGGGHELTPSDSSALSSGCSSSRRAIAASS